jgi:endonuclease/exonuclease/phosphatase (EEP) superfamily protein YafD
MRAAILAESACGVDIRYTPRRIDGYTMAFISAQVRVTGVSTDPTVVVAHAPGPWPYPIDDWRRDLDQLPVTLSEIGEQAGAGCAIVAGDVNSTTDMRPFRALLHNGYRDAAQQSGEGSSPPSRATRGYPHSSPLTTYLPVTARRLRCAR